MKKIIIYVVFIISILNIVSADEMSWFDEEAPPSCDSCAGPTMFSAYFENNLDITQGDPCGCSDGNSTITLNGDMAFSSTRVGDSGVYSLHMTDRNDYVAIPVTNAVELDPNDFKIVLLFNMDIYGQYGRLYSFTDGSNTIQLYTDSAATNTTFTSNIGGISWMSRTTTFGEDEWIRVTVEFKENVAGVDHRLEVCQWTVATQTASNCTEITEDLDPGTGYFTTDTFTFKYGNDWSPDQAGYLDKLTITKATSF